MTKHLHNQHVAMRRRLQLLATLAMVSVGCGAGEAPDQTHPTDTATAAVSRPADRPVLRVGVISRYNPVIMYRNYQPMMDFLSQETIYRFELRLGRTYEDAVQLLGSGDVDLAILGGLTYLEARKQFGARPLVKPLNAAGSPFYHSIFITRDDSPLTRLADLSGHSLALASFHSTAGNLIPRYELDRAGVPMQKLSQVENLPHYEMVVRAILKGHFDAGAVKDLVADQYRPKGLRRLHVSDPIPSGPVVCRADLPDSVAQAVAAVLLQIDPRMASSQIFLQDWDAEFRHGFVKAHDADYDGLRRILNSAPDGCGRGCHPAIRL
ncbi:MAG: phosphate/phosphite/phosphonate ABC transporter substrate-binding protein [Gemmatimonadetes bacterium]|jgi:phosphonate transport system substrate-binding protein|nr:phosphate/phosphite/phosphonate ABC transporter substrate-binding protein [Gemmatimonadota bacterium]MBT6143847.1 phosphate/phosphite/phosphonate ABC transporter substrate-binding protein [Gemmatimonadota bacterium]MBT7861266.1 phosphate/phosphite/phosphonate ABC transporter substrate-binding protein [Gemmatimonadota bacterium]